MNIQTAIMNRRTIRLFKNKEVSTDTVIKLAELSRTYASGGNLQPIRYIVVTNQSFRDQIFDTLKWAAYLPNFEIRAEQRPMAYVILTGDNRVKKNCQFDLGAAATTLMLAAEEEGLSTCCLGSFDTRKIISLFALPEWEEPLLVIALGYPDQKSRAVPMEDSVKYYEDEDGCLCVPKRMPADIVTVY